ncbi:MAG: hypothetical protein U5K54_25410 [Cytophagales bacterium]|nr:hypothetical protein [Cytophagales bacterium]
MEQDSISTEENIMQLKNELSMLYQDEAFINQQYDGKDFKYRVCAC